MSMKVLPVAALLIGGGLLGYAMFGTSNEFRLAEFQDRTSPRPTHPIDGDVPGDAHHPGREALALVQATQAGVGAQKSLLHDVLCQMKVPADPVHRPDHHFPVPFDQHAERFRFATARTGHKALVVRSRQAAGT